MKSEKHIWLSILGDAVVIILRGRFNRIKLFEK